MQVSTTVTLAVDSMSIVCSLVSSHLSKSFGVSFEQASNLYNVRFNNNLCFFDRFTHVIRLITSQSDNGIVVDRF